MLVLLVLTLAATASAYVKTYHGYELLDVTTVTQNDRDLITQLRNDIVELDIWSQRPAAVEMLVSPERLGQVKQYFVDHNLPYRVLKGDVQSGIEAEMKRLAAKETRVFDGDDFNIFDDIVSELYSLAGRCRADLGVLCDVNVLGQTVEGRDLLFLNISRSGSGRKGIWMDATTHAREWLSTATHMKIATKLVDDYPTDTEVAYLVDTYNWYLMPVVNPDGYDYTWTTDRYWRKNRSPNAGSNCLGTDLNRNFDQMWSNAGSSDSPCSDTYHGDGPASELEVQASQSQADTLGPDLLTSFHLHTYGQLWLIPWGSQIGPVCNIAEDHDEMMVVANAAADAVENTHGTTWERGNSCETLYPASGFAADYYKDLGTVKYTCTPELRGNDFVISNIHIQPSFEEMWNGVTTAIYTIETQP